MKNIFLFSLPVLFLVSLYQAGGFSKNDTLGTTVRDSLHPYDEDGCDENNFIGCYKAIIKYIGKGETAIRISNATDAVMVIGLTRVGKSTTTQFVANYSNPLLVECKGTECYLLDDSGDGGNDVVSKTFVPNTMEHIDANGVITPFYDMPGFDDTRSVAVEIANSFFIQRVIKGIERIKIMVVAKHASFTPTETAFKNLLGNLIKFTRTPEKFQDSIILIANMGHYDIPDKEHFETQRDYLIRYNESMIGSNSSYPLEDIPVARGWVNIFAKQATDNPAELANAAVFRTPPFSLKGKTIRGVPIYEKDYQRMKNLIWDRTEFAPVTTDDIGFTLSTEADKFLDDATLEASNAVKQQILNFTKDINEHLQKKLQVITELISEEEMETFLAYYNIMKALAFQNCNSSPQSSPQACVSEIQNQLKSLAEDLNTEIFEEIRTMTEFLQFAFASVKKTKNYDMLEWVIGFKQIPLDLEKEIKLRVNKLSSSVRVRLTNFANETGVYLEKSVETISQSASEEQMGKFLEHFNTMKTLDLSQCGSDPDSPPEGCLSQVSTQISDLANEMGSPAFQEVNTTVKFLQFTFADIKLNKSYDMTEWTNGFREVPNFVEQKSDRIASIVSGKVSAYLKGNFSNNIRQYFQAEIQGLQTDPIPADEALVILNTTIKELLLTKPDKLQSCIKLSSPKACYKEIIEKMKFLITASRSDIKERLVKPVSFLEFVHENFNNTEVDVRDWVVGFAKLQATVAEENMAGVKVIYDKQSLQAENLASSISKSILSPIKNFTVIEDLTQHLRVTDFQLQEINKKLQQYGDEGSLGGYIDLIINEYSKIQVEHQNASALRINAIRMIENIKIFPWYTHRWGDFHKTNLEEPVSAEYAVCRFLLDLFSDLESYSVQSSDVLQKWRKSEAGNKVEISNFDAFWKTFEEFNIHSMTTHKINYGIIYKHIGLNEYSRVWLNQALDYTLLWKSECPLFGTDIALLEGKYLSLSFVKRCLENRISKKIVILNDEKFFFDSNVTLTENLDTKIQIFVMSRHFDTTKQEMIEIIGKGGDPPPIKPNGTDGTDGNNGENGFDGADILGVYLTKDGSDVKVEACGGYGGDGQDGGDGRNSDPTEKPNLYVDKNGLVPDDRCSATSGLVKVHLYPNSCNRNSDSDNGCGAGDNGVWVAIWGPKPAAPILGGQGGYGGNGGRGGLSVMLDVSALSPKVNMFSNGNQGDDGRKGHDGEKGKQGATCVNLDDKHCGSCGRKRCYRNNDGDINYECKGFRPIDTVKSGIATINKTGIVPLRPVGQYRIDRCTSKVTSHNNDVFQEFKEYIKMFYTTANQNLNIFNRKKMTEFLNHVKNHKLLLNGEIF